MLQYPAPLLIGLLFQCGALLRRQGGLPRRDHLVQPLELCHGVGIALYLILRETRDRGGRRLLVCAAEHRLEPAPSNRAAPRTLVSLLMGTAIPPSAIRVNGVRPGLSKACLDLSQ